MIRPARLGAALVLVGLMAAMAHAVSRGPPSRPSLPSVPSTPSLTSAPSVPAASRPTVDEATTSRPTTTHILAGVDEERAPRRVLRQGMEAWGRFAVTGDLEEVAPWFSVRGPQWGQFQTEAPDLVARPLGEPPYTVLVEEERVHEGPTEVRVEARVSFIRTGEPSQSFHWAIILRREEGQWAIWTVEGLQAEESSSSMGIP